MTIIGTMKYGKDTATGGMLYHYVNDVTSNQIQQAVEAFDDICVEHNCILLFLSPCSLYA
jgi:hypothetical protein